MPKPVLFLFVWIIGSLVTTSIELALGGATYQLNYVHNEFLATLILKTIQMIYGGVITMVILFPSKKEIV